MTVLISAAFRATTLIRGKALIRERRLFQCEHSKWRCLLEGSAYLMSVTY